MNNSIALVTGASSGIGEAIAFALIKAGHRVYGTSRSPRESKPDGIQFLQMNVDEEASVKTAVGELLAKEGRIDVVVNSAGLGVIGAVEEVPMELAKRVFETNYFGTMRVCQAVIPSMRKQRSGCIINISSIGGEVGLPFRGIYSASKFAVEGMTEALRMELRPFGVRTVIIQPGDFNTNIGADRPTIDHGEDSPYEHYLREIRAEIDKGMASAPTPEAVGEAVIKIVRSTSPGFRYRVGAFMETLTPKLKKVFPHKLYEHLIMGHYRMHEARLMKEEKEIAD